MKPETTGSIKRGQNSNHIQGERPNWILLAGGALLSTLSIRIGCKLKQAYFDRKRMDNTHDFFKENRKSIRKEKLTACPMHANMYCFKQDEDSCYHCLAEGGVDIKRDPTSPMSKNGHPSLPLVTVPTSESSRENGIMWSSSPDHLEVPPKLFQHSNSSDSPCVSDSGSDIFSKREVIQKLRQQLKRRDEMILEMQAQLTNFQSSLSSHMTHSANLQSQIDSANRDLFDSEQEIQRLRKVISDHCVAESGSQENYMSAPKWHPEMNGHAINGHANGYMDRSNNDLERHCIDGIEKSRDSERVQMLKREVEDLKEVIEGKEFLLQSYKEQKVELSAKVKELQLRRRITTPQVPNIL